MMLSTSVYLRESENAFLRELLIPSSAKWNGSSSYAPHNRMSNPLEGVFNGCSAIKTHEIFLKATYSFIIYIHLRFLMACLCASGDLCTATVWEKCAGWMWLCCGLCAKPVLRNYRENLGQSRERLLVTTWKYWELKLFLLKKCLRVAGGGRVPCVLKEKNYFSKFLPNL